VRAELLAVGDELLVGDIVNGNAAWLGQQLTTRGIEVVASTVVGDDVDRIAAAVRAAFDRAGTVVVTGGIGPTQDDLTRAALARAAGVELRRDADLEAGLRARFTALRRDVPEMNYRQADMPEGATPIPNVRGTAPGVRFELLGGVAYALPGVPHEMQQMFTDHVLPDVVERAGDPAVTVTRVIRTAGMWESAVADSLSEQVSRCQAEGRVRVAFLASGGQTRVKLSCSAPTRAEALEILSTEEEQARAALGVGVYGSEDDTLEQVVLALLRDRGETVGVAESLTGGLLGATLSAPEGASSTFRGGIVSYATEMKAALLGVPEDVLERHGAVSGETAEAMAAGVRDRLDATYGLALTGVAGPGEQEGKPVGTVHVGLAGPDVVLSRALRLPGDRALVRTYACVSAMNVLRLHLLDALPAS
jgi:nicotinamide-nucleotide amidase